jgi:hypothetical protein
MRQGTSGFCNAFQVLPQHVSASGCHLQGVVGALEANQAVSVLWACTDYDPSRGAICSGMSDRNPYSPQYRHCLSSL